MAKVKFTRLIITDWRCGNVTIDFSEHTKIVGRNGSGKSRTRDAILWLFTGYDSENRSNYQLFNTTVIPTHENSRPASVELFFTKDDLEYKLKKTARMGWSKSRESDTYEKKPSDEYTFEIDGVEVSATKYKEFVESTFCPIDKLKFILNIDYFLMLDWKELRKNFADIIGEVHRDEYGDQFKNGFALIDRYGSIDNARQHLSSERKECIRTIGEGDFKGSKIIELETLEHSLPDISDYERLNARANEINDRLKNLGEAKIGRYDVNKAIIDERNRINKEINALQIEYDEKQSAYDRAFKNDFAELESQLNDVDDQNFKIKAQNEEQKLMYEKSCEYRNSLEEKIKYYEKHHQELTDKVLEIRALEFKDDKCAYCGAPLTGAMLEEAKRKFEEGRDEQEKTYIKLGQENRKEWNKRLEEFDALNEKLAKNPKPILLPLLTKDDIEIKIAALRDSYIPFNESTQAKKIMARIEQKRANIPNLFDVDTSDIEDEEKKLKEELFEVSKAMGKKQIYDATIKKIAMVKSDIANTSSTLTRVMKDTYEIEQIERMKAEIIKNRIAKLFQFCTIEMEERKKDGEMIPACNLSMKGVKAQVTNTASKILIGADISNAFSTFYNLSMPLIVDNRERIDSDVLIENINQDRQTIELERQDCDFKVI